MRIFLSYTDWKALGVVKNRVRYDPENDLKYHPEYRDSDDIFCCDVLKDDGSDQTDFETNYVPYANVLFEKFDADNVPMMKDKITQNGWRYNQRSIGFTTSLLSSVYSKKNNGDDWNHTTLKFYDVDGVELTDQGDLDTDCVKTRLDWEPPYNYDLLSGLLNILSLPEGYSNTARIWAVAVPDVPSAYGGSINFVDGRTLRSEKDLIIADGRRVATLPYDATYHTNKIRLIIRHEAGNQLKLEMMLEHYYMRT